MTESFDPAAHKPSATELDELPTAYGGTSHVEPAGPGQSLGQQPDPDDAGVDEAGDRPDASGSRPPDVDPAEVAADEEDEELAERDLDEPEDLDG